jgi:hypothetical protein
VNERKFHVKFYHFQNSPVRDYGIKSGPTFVSFQSNFGVFGSPCVFLGPFISPTGTLKMSLYKL